MSHQALSRGPQKKHHCSQGADRAQPAQQAIAPQAVHIESDKTPRPDQHFPGQARQL